MSVFIEQQLHKYQQKEQSILTVINTIIHSQVNLPVDTLAKKHFLSTRQFERKFKNFSGFSPKLFSRIIRFQSAISHYGNRNRSLTDIAYDCVITTSRTSSTILKNFRAFIQGIISMEIPKAHYGKIKRG